MQGIYKITNKFNDKVYIGSSVNVTNRWKQHLEKLIYNVHGNYKLQNDFNKYEISAFNFSILEIVKDNKNLFSREQEWIDSIDVENNYNILSYAKSEYIGRIKNSYNILDFNVDESIYQKLKCNLIICTHEKLNNIGVKKNDLSKSWYNDKNIQNFECLRKNIYNFQKNIIKCATKDFYWTTFISYQKSITYKGFKKRFISLTDIPKLKCNTLAYLVNMYSNPYFKNILKINDDEYALKTLLNWITNVADINKPINIYIPSVRMRDLLQDWLNKASIKTTI